MIMNISATSSTQITPQASFGRDYQIEDAERVMKLTEELQDSFKKNDEVEHKSASSICVSVLGAVLTSFILGKCAASKVMTAFPSITSKLSSGLRKGANLVRDFSDDVAQGVKLKKGGKGAKFVAKNIGKAEKFAREQFVKLRDKSSTENIITNAVGLASVATIAPEVLSVDGNKDGVSDIAQKNVNAYRNAINNVGIVSEIVEALA